MVVELCCTIKTILMAEEATHDDIIEAKQVYNHLSFEIYKG